MAKRLSLAIKYKAAQTLYYAPQQAERIGLPLNVLVTLNLANTGICPTEATTVFSEVHMRFRKWVTRPGRGEPGLAVKATWSYAFENVRDERPFLTIGPGLPHNVHVLWYAHVPISRMSTFEKWLPLWLEDAAGPHDPNAIDVQRVLEDNGITGYGLKGAEEAVARHFGVKEKNRAPQGAIIGKRSGTSQNIGSAARKRTDRALGIRRYMYAPRPSAASA